MAMPKRLKRVLGVSVRSLYDPIRLTSVCQLEKKLRHAIAARIPKKKKKCPEKNTVLYFILVDSVTPHIMLLTV